LQYDVTASGSNHVQGGTIYQCLSGLIDGCKTNGAAIGYYEDYYRRKGLHITANNSFKGGDYGVIIRNSPTATGAQELTEQFSAENYLIEKFDCDARAADVYIIADPPNTDSRYIRNMAVDERLRLVHENLDPKELHMIPAPDTKRTGCARLNPFAR
jgi:hypothetical protein